MHKVIYGYTINFILYIIKSVSLEVRRNKCIQNKEKFKKKFLFTERHRDMEGVKNEVKGINIMYRNEVSFMHQSWQ